jgi:hypothetical protein
MHTNLQVHEQEVIFRISPRGIMMHAWQTFE